MTETELEKKWENTVWDTDVYLDDIDGEDSLTNEEWFCGLSTEEKAKWIAEEKMCRGYFIFPSMEEAIQDALEWLKQPHREG